MNKSEKIITGLLIGAVVIAVGGIVGGNYIKNRKEVVDDSRVAFTIHGSQNDKWTYAYVFMEHPELDEPVLPLGTWNGIMPKAYYEKDGYDFISYNGDNSYTIELTELLPLEYDNFTEFLDDGGTCGLVLSYYTNDNTTLIQSQNIMLEESGNHYLSLPTENNGTVAHEVVKYTKYVYEKEESSKEDSSSVNDDQSSVENSSDTSSDITNESTSEETE